MKSNIILVIQLLFPLVLCSQSLVSVNPNTAFSGQTLNVTISGSNTHFQQGSTTVFFDFNQVSGTTVINSINVQSITSIDANITVPATTANGYYDVHTNNSVDGPLVLTAGFYVGFVGIEEGKDLPSFSIYPNPAHKIMNIEYNNPGTISERSFSIYDLQGKLILHQKMSQKTTKIDIDTLKKGVYLVKVQYNNTETLTKKIIIK